MRFDGRSNDQLRTLSFERDYTEMAAGSVLVSFGKTRVLCTASIDEDVPRWMRGSGKGWVTAEYSMLPGASPERIDREAAKGKQSGRTVEIQRLIGRSLRAACDMELLGERQVIVDCDVLQADGGTRTASICGGFIALHDALTRLQQRGAITSHPLHSFCAAISVGLATSPMPRPTTKQQPATSHTVEPAPSRLVRVAPTTTSTLPGVSSVSSARRGKATPSSRASSSSRANSASMALSVASLQ